MGYEVIDLSQEIFTGAPHWPEHPDTKVDPVAWHRGGSPRAMYLHMCDHAPTHTDAISHVDERPAAPTIDAIPLGSFVTRGIALDFTGMVPARAEISLDLLRRQLGQTHLIPPRGGTVLITAGHHRRTYPGPGYMSEFPGLSGEAADYLYRECGVLNIGQDAPSVDAAVNVYRDEFPCHDLCRELQRVNSENLASIEDVAGREFLYLGLPLRIRAGTGSPVRAAAVLDL
jgi:kynurenine formamidase